MSRDDNGRRQPTARIPAVSFDNVPTYVYRFVDTGETIEIQQSFDDPTLTEATHPVSGATLAVKKVFLPVGVTFRGDGFYKTDSRGSGKKSSSSSEGGATSSGDTPGTKSPASSESGSSAPAAASTTSSASAPAPSD
jgi:predicted nucleic acid-binding Zn ribbon protein